MKSTRMLKPFLLIIAFAISSLKPACGNEQLTDTTGNRGVQFTGMTKTLSSLLKTRASQTILLGAYEMDPEKLVDEDLAAVFD